jgi:hypothetical protein
MLGLRTEFPAHVLLRCTDVAAAAAAACRYPTKGGFFMDVKLSFDHMDTKHR